MRSGSVRPVVREMIHEAVEALRSPTSNVAVRNWIEARYPGTNRGTIQAHITICTVNKPSRIRYTQNRGERSATDSRYDFLFSPGRGQLEWYKPKQHGRWSIEEDKGGRRAIRCDGGKFIYPSAQEGSKSSPRRESHIGRPVELITQEQIGAASVLHGRLSKWAATDRAFERLGRSFGWDLESCILKSAAINDLYSTRVYAVWRMAEHLMNVMKHPPADPASLVREIASLPGKVPRKHWSFASKIAHFFIDRDRFPIYDSYSRRMIGCHLGRANCVSDHDNPYGAFITNLMRLREASRLTCTLREMDRYFWLAGQYTAFLRKGKRAQLNSELRALFEKDDLESQRLLRVLVPDGGSAKDKRQ